MRAMQRLRRNAWRHVCAVLACASMFMACGPAVPNITVKTPAPATADPDRATLVIVQPTTRFQSVNILDQDGRLLGQLNDRSHTTVRIPPGTRRLYAVPEKQAKWADRIEGSFQAGRTYYATLSMRWGGVSFLALNPRSRDDRWSHKDEYLAATPHVQMDPNRASEATGKLGDTSKIIKLADAYADRLDDAHRAEHLVRSEDGT